MRLRSIIGSLLTLGLLLVIPMNAVADSSFLKPLKLYAGGSLAIAKLKGCEDVRIGGGGGAKGCEDFIDTRKFSGDLFAGVKVGKYFSLEFLYIPEISTVEKQAESDDIDVTSLGGVIAFRYPFSKHFTPYFRFGVMYTEIKEGDKGAFPTPAPNVDPKTKGLSGLYGVGAECQFYGNFFARIGYDWMPDVTGWSTGSQSLNENFEDNALAAADLDHLNRFYLSIYYQF